MYERDPWYESITKKKNEFLMMVWGSCGVGKSQLVLRFCENVFFDEYDPTIEDSYRKPFDVDGTMINFNVIELAGCEEFCRLHEGYVKKCYAALLVFDIAKRASFDEIDEFRRFISMIKADMPIVLCGNKCDLFDKREVSTMEGKALADSHGWFFIETSAKTSENVKNAFVLVYEAYSNANCNENPEEPPPGHHHNCIIC